jgi:hypothetical protein
MINKNILLGVALLVTSGLANASFDSGLPAGWVCNGACGTLSSDGVVSASPLGSSAYGYVTTYNSSSNNGLNLGVETNGTILTSTAFNANAGDSLDFYFNFITSDGAGYADYAWAKLLNSDGSDNALLFTARTKTSGNIIPGQDMPTPNATVPNTAIISGAPAWSALGGSSGTCYSGGCGYTGWVLSSFEIALSGEYKLEFGVVNWSDTSYDTGMAFDGVTVAGKDISVPNAVPVPAAAWLFGSGLLGFAGSRRKKYA